MTRIVERGQLVAMDTVAIADDLVHDDGRQRDQNQNDQIAQRNESLRGLRCHGAWFAVDAAMSHLLTQAGAR